MSYECFVCKTPITRDTTGRDDGRVHMEGVTEGNTRNWLWGPVTVHYGCRTKLRTPFDDEGYGGDRVATWETMAYDH